MTSELKKQAWLHTEVLNLQSHTHSILIAVVHQRVNVDVAVTYDSVSDLLDAIFSSFYVPFSLKVLQKIVSMSHNLCPSHTQMAAKPPEN